MRIFLAVILAASVTVNIAGLHDPDKDHEDDRRPGCAQLLP